MPTAVQNEFNTVRDFLGNEFGTQKVNLTNKTPSPDTYYSVRTGGFFQWSIPKTAMSSKWENRMRALAARQMAMLAYVHWEAAGRPATFNIGRCVTTKDSNKVLWFLDL